MSEPASPYKFLDSYDESDRDRFFGRTVETDVLLSDIVINRLVVLFAKTGTGKTSLINAGVRPLLRDRGYATFFVRVRDENPFDSARAAIKRERRGKLPADGSFADQMRGLSLRLRAPVVLLFDQFEEFFLYTAAKDPETTEEFIRQVGDLYDDESSGVHVVFSMREEWFVHMGLFREAIPAIFHNDSNLQLRWLDRDRAREAIVGPLGKKAFGRGVVDRLLDELLETGKAVAGIPSPGDIEPAQLQIVCDTIWRANPDRTITERRYEALGGRHRAGTVAQQILDRRLVEEFERFKTRDEFDLVTWLLPELKTPEGTKRVRDVDDLLEAALSAPGLHLEPSSFRRVLKGLEAARLLEIVPREAGELVELVHDYLVLRLDALHRPISLIWPRKLLRDGVEAYRKSGALLESVVLPDVIARVQELELDRGEGELLLRSALAQLADVAPILPEVEHSGAPVWKIFQERIVDGADSERVRAIETLAQQGSRGAYAVLRRALANDTCAPDVIRALSQAAVPDAVSLLARAAESPRYVDSARAALAALADIPGSPNVTKTATDALRRSIAHELGSPDTEQVAIDALVALDSPVGVELLAELLKRPSLAPKARSGLASSSASGNLSTAAAARRALFAEIEQSLGRKRPEPWCVDVLRGIEDENAVLLLGRLALHRPLRPQALEALDLAKVSEDAGVAAAAAKEYDRLAGRTPSETPSKPGPVSTPSTFGRTPSGAHYAGVLQLLANGRVVPFLGAGVNMIGRAVSEPWRPGRTLPTGVELAQDLASKWGYPEHESIDLLRVASYVQAVADTRTLYDELREDFQGDYAPNRLHDLIARLPATFRRQGRRISPRLIVTSTYDDLLERAFDTYNEPYDVVTYIADGPHRGKFSHRPRGRPAAVIEAPERYANLSLDERVVILRLYGGIDRTDRTEDSFVITEDDYIDFAVNAASKVFLPLAIASVLSDSGFLFLGYGLRDWSLRILLRALGGLYYRSYPSWAVQANPSSADSLLWQQRSVEVVESSLEDYTVGLERELGSFDASVLPA